MPMLVAIRRLRPSAVLLLFALVGASVPAAAAGMAPVPMKPAASSALEIAFEPDAVVVSGLAPAAEVLLHGVSRYHDVYYWAVVPTDETLTADETGTARYEPANGVAPFSVWAAIDPASGDLAIAKPYRSIAREVPFPAQGLGQSPVGVVSRLHTPWERANILFVRPGVGAWLGLGVSGTPDAPPVGAEVAVGSALPLQSSAAPPAELTPGDVVMAVDPETLDYFAARLVPPGQQP